jgi:hypothetical protein
MRIEGRAEPGAKLVVHLGPVGGHGGSFKPTVLTAVPGRELRWLGRLGPGGIVDGEHFFVLSPNPGGGTTLNHGETFSGALVALVKFFDRGNLEQSHNGYEDFSLALKQRIEANPGGHSDRIS